MIENRKQFDYNVEIIGFEPEKEPSEAIFAVAHSLKNEAINLINTGLKKRNYEAFLKAWCNTPCYKFKP